MQNISWPMALVLSVLTISTTWLVWKGSVPSHVFFAIGGAILGYFTPRSAARAVARGSGLGTRPEECGQAAPVLVEKEKSHDHDAR